MGGSKGGGTGGQDPPGKSQKYSFFSNTDRNPLVITKLPSCYSMMGYGVLLAGPIIAPAFSGICILSPPYQLKKVFRVE